MDGNPFRTIVYFVGIFALVLSALYLLGYWGCFQFNVLEFIGFSEALNHALYPLLVALVPGIVGFVYGSFSSPPLQPGAGADTRIGSLLRNNSRILLLSTGVLALLIVWFCPEPDRWFFLMFPFGFAALPFYDTELLIRLMPHPGERVTIVLIVPMLAMSAFAGGRRDGTNILRGRAPLLVDIKASGLQLPFDEQHPVAYVGHEGGFFFFYESSAPRLVIVREEDVGSLVLMKNPNLATLPRSPSPSSVATPTAKMSN